MPAAVSPSITAANAADRRRSFEEFLGSCEASRDTRRRCQRTEYFGDDCILRGEWSPLPEAAKVVAIPRLPYLGSATAPATKSLWSTSFFSTEKSPSENIGTDVGHMKEGLHHQADDAHAYASHHTADASQHAADASQQAPAASDMTAHEYHEMHHHEPIFTWKMVAALSVVGLLSGGGGFAAAMALQKSAAEAEDPFDILYEEAEAAHADADQSPEAVAETEAEEEARLQQIAELEEQKRAAAEQLNEIAQRKEELQRELQPSLDEVDAELQDLDAQIAAEEEAARAAELGTEPNTPAQAAAGQPQAGAGQPQAAAGQPQGGAGQPQAGAGQPQAAEGQGETTSIQGKLYSAVFDGNRFEEIIQDRVTAVRTKLPQVITEELNNGLADLTTVLEEGIGTEEGGGGMDAMGLPSLSLLIASYCAPSQLNMLANENQFRMTLCAVLLSLDVLSILTAGTTKCLTWVFGNHGYYLRPWITIDAIALGFSLAVRILAGSTVKETKEMMQTFEEAPLELPPEPLMAHRAQLDRHMIIGSAAMVQLDKLGNNAFFQLLDFMPVFEFFWQFLGITLLFDTPVRFCQAEVLMLWARMRGIVFLIGLLPAITNLALAIVKKLVKSPAACTAVLQGADSLDKIIFPQGPAVTTLLVRAFLVRDPRDMEALELQVVEFQTQLKQHQRDKAKRELDSAENNVARHAEAYETKAGVYSRSKEDEFLDEYGKIVGKVCETVEFAADPTAVAQRAAEELRAAVGDLGLPPPPTMQPQHPSEQPDDMSDDGGDGGTGGGRLSSGAAAGP